MTENPNLTSGPILTSADVGKLLADTSPTSRAVAAAQVSKAFTSGLLGEKERAIVEEIFQLLVRDTEELVRRSLSESLKTDPNVPHDIAQALAMDVASVALPIIEFSEVLSDADLLEIINSKPAEQQIAVAKRNRVSGGVADALASTHNGAVVATLVGNVGAEIGEQTFARVLDEFAQNEVITDRIMKRPQLPLTVSTRVVTMVSENLYTKLMAHNALSPDALTDLIMRARETAIVGMLQNNAKTKDVIDLVDELFRQKRLTSTILMRALCMGDVTFFEASLARMAGISVQNAYILVHDGGGLGLKALFEKCALSPKMLTVAHDAIKIADGLQLNSNDDRMHFQKLMIERLLTKFEDDFASDSLDYLITRLGSESVSHQAA